MGLQLESTSSSWLLDSMGSGTINQLARTQSCFSGASDFSPSSAFHNLNSNGQHYQPILYQQTRRDSLSGIIGTSNRSLELVSTAQDSDSGTTHQRSEQHDSRYGITQDLLQESDNQAIAKVRILATRSGRYPHGCVYHPVDDVSPSVHQPSLEPHYESTPQGCAGTTSSGNSGGTLLAQCDLVSSSPTSSFDGSLAVASTVGSDNVSTNSSSVAPPTLDALRVDIIRSKLERQNLNAQAVKDLLAERLADNATNQQYRRNQLRFLAWATRSNVSFTSFNPSDVVNFLANMRQEHNMQASTLKTLRTAVAHLHDDTAGISEDPLINSYLDTIAKQAPPVSIHRPTIDASPALAYARSIISRSSTDVKLLQQKLAFLLAMAAFLRPSDMARIPFTSCSISENGCLLLQVVAPKETRGKRRIIKPFSVHPHAEDLELCPVQCFKALRDHPALQARPTHSNLFVKSNKINQPLSASTISTWLHREFISLCTDEPGVSIQSLASSRALDYGISLDNIVALGNWASSDTFVRHYQRNQMAEVDFTSTVLSSQDEFFDANDSFDTLD
ncbi:hypothetical protein G6F16_012240 [Rhizopus arrhizus]|nr:hypothetical protein G6F21_012067 [Rhizopus arrhizus]KAG0804807.1 hypothetical protein G6F20_012406 [Rhizopus arrhizus]KAG0820862.1 hypothetical protein G6F19_012235 [Rhizopus arrhizus]KAG0821332.1 hypothetical protein G6F18_012232 [Rhizopus arrhizus]KAG0847763.1 hypothetical protein G6F17_012241 [Rhizopus arrhizus]